MSTADLLNDVLTVEYAAAYGLPVVAARIEALAERAERCATAHAERIEALTALVDDAGGSAAAPRATYRVPRLSTRAEAEEFVRELERACLTAYVQVVSAGEVADRAFATEAMVEVARWLVRWGAEPEAFPGLTLR